MPPSGRYGRLLMSEAPSSNNILILINGGHSPLTAAAEAGKLGTNENLNS